MADIQDSVANIIREEIDQGIDESLPALDPVVTKTVASDMGVYRSGIGRDWKVKHTFAGSIAGAFAWRAANGGDIDIDGSSGNNSFALYGNNAMQTWQGPNEMSEVGYIQKELQLKEGYGNFKIPLQLLRSDKLDSAVGSAVTQIVKGAAKRQALAMVHAFWKNGENNAIGQFTSDGTDITPGSDTEITLTAGRIRSFFPGLAVQIFLASDGSAPTGLEAGEPVWVNNVNYLAKKLDLTKRGGTATVELDAAAYIILPYDGTTTDADGSVGISGLEDFIKDGTETDPTVYGINVANYAQFRSIKVTGLSGDLDSPALNKHIGGFIDAYGAELDTIVTTAGVMLGFIENVDSSSLIRYDIQGEALNVNAGFQPWGYMYDGKSYRFMTSPNCPRGIVYVLKLKDGNLRKYVPPRLNGAGSEGRFSGSCEFVAPVMGSKNIFLPVYSNDRPANFLQAPYLHWCEICPKMVQGIKLGTFTEEIYTG